MDTITINFDNATLTSSTSQIILTNGNFALEAASALSLAGTVSFSSLYITSGAIGFNVQSGRSFNATIVAPVNAAAGGSPTLQISNFAGTVTATWPTSQGMQTQTLMSGDPITLSGFAS